ncbi:MAG TPA: hypothetical protein VGU45_03420 [Microvirga sp.]|jgi:translation initiation factor IF-2|nr:hypothetical protein [Microvirga sp.]
MSRAFALLLCLAAGAAHAQECTPAIENRWAAATREDERGAQVIARETKKGAKADRAAICRVAQTVPNLLKAAREYYAACDPDDAAAALAPIQAHADRAAAFHAEECGNLPAPAAAPAAAPKPPAPKPAAPKPAAPRAAAKPAPAPPAEPAPPSE